MQITGILGICLLMILSISQRFEQRSFSPEIQPVSIPEKLTLPRPRPQEKPPTRNFPIQFSSLAPSKDICKSQTEYKKEINKPPIVISFETYVKNYRPYLDKTVIPQSLNLKSDQNRYHELIFYENLKKINAHNSDNSRTYDMGVNRYAHIPAREFSQVFYSLNVDSNFQNERRVYFKNKNSKAGSTQGRGNQGNFEVLQKSAEGAIDWSCKGIPIKNQGQKCGCCYAITAVDTILFTYSIHQVFTMALSFQELISCGTNTYNLFGCQGGFYNGAFQYVKENGVGFHMFYPYSYLSQIQGIEGACLDDLQDSTNVSEYLLWKKKIVEKHYINFHDCDQMKDVLKTRAIAAAIVADDNLQSYAGGTYTPALGATSSTVNHGVTVIGYYPGQGFKARNSWGNSFNNGIIMLNEETTGVCDYSMYVTIQSQKPEDQINKCQVDFTC